MELFPVILFILIGVGVGTAIIVVSNYLGAKPKSKREFDVYESGMNPVGEATRKYDVKFYLTAILFLLFDIEIVFLVPWALNFHKSSNQLLMMAEFVFFMIILIAGYLFVLMAKGLDWED